MAKERGKMSRAEAGKLGGEATSKKHDSEFYSEIGQKGGQESGGNFKNDPERAREAGKKGGQASTSRSREDTEEI